MRFNLLNKKPAPVVHKTASLKINPNYRIVNYAYPDGKIEKYLQYRIFGVWASLFVGDELELGEYIRMMFIARPYVEIFRTYPESVEE